MEFACVCDSYDLRGKGGMVGRLVAGKDNARKVCESWQEEEFVMQLEHNMRPKVDDDE